MENKSEQKCISQFDHENAMMHLQMAIRKIVIVAVAGVFFLVIAIVIFVTAYTSRTKEWLNTYNMVLQNRPAVTEVANGVYKQPNP